MDKRAYSDDDEETVSLLEGFSQASTRASGFKLKEGYNNTKHDFEAELIVADSLELRIKKITENVNIGPMLLGAGCLALAVTNFLMRMIS